LIIEFPPRIIARSVLRRIEMVSGTLSQPRTASSATRAIARQRWSNCRKPRFDRNIPRSALHRGVVFHQVGKRHNVAPASPRGFSHFHAAHTLNGIDLEK
jgi:hypothetical protein